LVLTKLCTNRIEIEKAIRASYDAGLDIKQKCNELLYGGVETDQLITNTVLQLLKKNPFIQAAKRETDDWNSYQSHVVSIMKSSSSLGEFINKLWEEPSDKSLVFRRLLLRVAAT